MHGTGAPAAARVAGTRDWTRGNILHNLLLLSWPMMISQSLNMLGPTIDIIWVGRLGPAAIAGVGIAGMVEMLLSSLMMGIVMGLRALVARYSGARDHEGAINVARQAYVIAAVYWLLVALTGIFFAESIMNLLGVRPEVAVLGAGYLRIVFIGSAAMALRFVTEGIMQASGDSVTPMKIALVYRLLHIVLAPFLIFGLWIFPEMGVNGAALSSVIASTLGTSAGMWFLFSGRSRLRMHFRHFRLAGGTIWRIVRIAIPACITAMERTLGQLILMRIMVPFGTAAIAAHTIGQRVEMFVLMPVLGLSMGAGVLVGQNLGAGHPDRAERSGWLAAGVAEAFLAVCAVVVLIWAASIVRVFNADPGLVGQASDFLRIAAAGYLLMGIGALLGQAISGSGDTLPPMLITLLAMWIIQIPLAILLPRITGLDVYGVRWAMVIGSGAGAIAFLAYFRIGKWKRKRV